MPELPEVETIKNDLQLLINKTIKSVQVLYSKKVYPTKNIFTKQICEQRIKSISRRAKTIIFELQNKKFLVFHLKMTGQIIYCAKKTGITGGGHPIFHKFSDLPNKSTTVIFTLNSGKIFFNDTRKFGWVKLLSASELENLQNKLGPEPLDKNFTFAKFQELLTNKKAIIKPLLMNQNLIAGIGNIYAQETLFCAGINPTTATHKISTPKLKKLYTCLIKILQQAIKHKGTSSSDYVDAFGRQGSMNNHLKVYGRVHQPCTVCKTPLKQICQAQRSTVYCPKCQK